MQRLQLRSIEFNGRVKPETVNKLITELQRLSAPATVLFNSFGGLFMFLEHGNAVRVLKSLHFRAIAENVHSAANLLYLLGERRFAYADAHFHFHQISLSLDPDNDASPKPISFNTVAHYAATLTGDQQTAWMSKYLELHKARNWYIDFVTRHSGMPRATLDAFMTERGRTLTAREAKTLGIVEDILPRWL